MKMNLSLSISDALEVMDALCVSGLREGLLEEDGPYTQLEALYSTFCDGLQAMGINIHIEDVDEGE